MPKVAARRAYREHIVDSRWIGTVATIDRRGLFISHPTRRDARNLGDFSDRFALHCRLRYVFSLRQHVVNVSTLSGTSLATRGAIENWVRDHRPGAAVNVKVNPSDPDEIVVVSELPIAQFGTARQSWIVGLYCGGIGASLFALGRLLIPVRTQ